MQDNEPTQEDAAREALRGHLQNMIAQHIADDAGALLEGPVPVVVLLVHAEQHASMHRLQAVAGVGQGAADDHAHRVVEVGAAHLLFEADGQGFLGELGHAGVWGKGRIERAGTDREPLGGPAVDSKWRNL